MGAELLQCDRNLPSPTIHSLQVSVCPLLKRNLNNHKTFTIKSDNDWECIWLSLNLGNALRVKKKGIQMLPYTKNPKKPWSID